MYNTLDYLKRGVRFANNLLLPRNKKISTLMLYATDSCDSACKHCFIWAKKQVEHMSLDKIIEIMNSKCVGPSTVVGLEGGEFLLHPQSEQILEWFSNNHPNFDLLSNCLRPNKVIEAVKKYPPKRLFLSLDGGKETYKYMRGKDGYEKVLRVINECKDIVPISAMFTLSPYNSFTDLEHVIDVCKQHDIDVRIGIYNDIDFFNTAEKAHQTEIAEHKNTEINTFKTAQTKLKDVSFAKKENLNKIQTQDIATPKHDETKLADSKFKASIPEAVKTTSENYDFLLLYDEWRKKQNKLKCHSILDSIVIHPNGDVPICQNLGLKLGNVNKQSLDEIFNSAATKKIHKQHVHNCNQCWINFHRKYDIVLLRTLEKMIPKKLIELFYGKYQWTDNPKITYKKFMENYE